MTDAEISKPLPFYLQLLLWSCENISWRCQALGTSRPSCSPKSAGVQETFLKGQGYIKCTGDSCCPRVFPVSFLADRLIYLMLFVAFLCGFGYIPHIWSRVCVKESLQYWAAASSVFSYSLLLGVKLNLTNCVFQIIISLSAFNFPVSLHQIVQFCTLIVCFE